MSIILRLTVMIAFVMAFAGCRCLNFGVGPRRVPAYTVDMEKVGSGEQAIIPRNNASFWNGEPMDLRSD